MIREWCNFSGDMLVHAHQGHAPMLECPAEFDAALLDWLRIE
ncbi:hypothetical protein [Ferrovibrio sp.]